MKINYILIPVIIMFLLVGCSQNMTIGVNGNIKYISIEKSCDDKVIEFAAQELKSYVERMTGYKLQIIKEDKVRGKVISLKKINDKNLKWDGYKIITNNKGIEISANLSRGVLYGVYTLLKEQGCMFVYPNPDDEIVPKKPLLRFDLGVRIDNPVIEHRGMVPTMLYENNVNTGKAMFDWMAKNRFNYVVVCEERLSDVKGPGHLIRWHKISDILLPELQKRGFFIAMSEHCTHLFFPRSLYKKHPNWFAEINGKRVENGQICYSNQDAIDYYTKNMIDYVKKHKEISLIGTWPLDGGNYCKCQQCQNPTTVYKAICKIAAEIYKVRPDIIVEHLAYKQETWIPPIENMPSNMSVLWCMGNDKDMDELARQWVKKSKKAQGVYQLEYYLGDHYRTRSHVLLRPEYASKNVNYCREMGFRGIISIVITTENWFKYGFNGWMFGDASWTDFKGVKVNMNEYYNKYYPTTFVQMEKIFTSIFTEMHPEPFIQPLSIKKYADIEQSIKVGKDIVDKLDVLLSQVSNKIERRRIERVKVYVEYFMLQREAMVYRDSEHINKMIKYNREHSDFREVLIYPEYTIHTYKGFFKNLNLDKG